MSRRLFYALGLCLGPLTCAAQSGPAAPRDLYLGEAYFHAAQADYFDAVSRLDTELAQFHRLDDPKRDPLHFHANRAHFSVGDFELSYRMHQRAGRAIQAVLEGNVAEPVRNEAAWRLARIFMQKGDTANALQAIERIQGAVPPAIRNEEQSLRAQIYIHARKYPEAIAILKGLQQQKGYEGFAKFNLAMALIQSGEEAAGLQELEMAGKVNANDEVSLAVRDKTNLLLGNRLLTSGKAGQAKQYLDRVRLKGPFSNKALLSSGWADASQGKFDRALAPWLLLVKRNPTDKAVQEGLMGAPYAYAKLKLYGRAAQYYGAALESFEGELVKLDRSLKSIREGKFLKALVSDELKLDRNWVVKLREQPETPETYYLIELMASNDFQESLQNYFDLEDLRQRLTTWSGQLDAYEDIIQVRRQYYEGVLPTADEKFRALDSQMRLRIEQRQRLHERLQKLLISPQRDFLQTADERLLRDQLDQLAARYKDDPSAAGEEHRRRIRRLQGLAHWNIQTSYDQRLTEAYKHLHQLDADVERLNGIYRGFVRTRQAATQSFKGYDAQLRQLRNRVRDAREKVDTLMARQGQFINQIAIQELEQRRQRLEEYQVQARFALAENYDRAGKKQESGAK